jgi:hypothetical protein
VIVFVPVARTAARFSSTLQLFNPSTFLSRRPRHVAAPEKMEVNMKNALSRASATVDYYAEPFFGNPLIFGQLIGHRKNVADKAFIFLLQVEERCDMLSWHDQEMDRRLRVNVLKRYNGIVLIDDVPFDVAFNDPAK